MPSLYTEIEINAPRSAVWQVLVQKEYWLKWNTFLFDRSPTQSFEPGRSLLLSSRRLAGEEETEFEAFVTLVQPNTCLSWRASVPGFKNEHTFELQDVGYGWTKYTHREHFAGLISRFAFPLIRRDEVQGLRRMAMELKDYVESVVR